MRHEVEVELIERILAVAGTGGREMADSSYRAPVVNYVSPERHAQEVASLFRRYPVIVAQGSELAEPGDYRTHDLTGVPILVVRGEGGKLGAFLNVCRHRGARLVGEPKGHIGKAIVCPYHAWSYDRGGALLSVSDQDSFAGIDRASHGLVRLSVAERHGLVWVRPTPGEKALDIDGFLGPLAQDFAAFDLGRSVVYAPEELRRAMNWKVMVDTFLEDYHFRFVHGRSVYRFYLDNASIYERFGAHTRYIIPKRTILDLKGTDRATWRLRDHANILYYIFPNTVIVFVADHAAIFAMFPQGPERAVMHLSFCIPEEPSTEKVETYWRKNADLIRTALDEDFRVAEGVQAGFASGANTHLTFGRYEKGLAFFHQAIEEALLVSPRPSTGSGRG
jgi:phenylpropionate dioxygenase-like ring-hydroxylating dioxygenase large terminal subunit